MEKKADRKGWKKWLIVVLVLVMCWAGIQIFQYVNADIVPVYRFHWKILGYEALIVAGAYGLLGVTGKRKYMKR